MKCWPEPSTRACTPVGLQASRGSRRFNGASVSSGVATWSVILGNPPRLIMGLILTPRKLSIVNSKVSLIQSWREEEGRDRNDEHGPSNETTDCGGRGRRSAACAVRYRAADKGSYSL